MQFLSDYIGIHRNFSVSVTSWSSPNYNTSRQTFIADILIYFQLSLPKKTVSLPANPILFLPCFDCFNIYFFNCFSCKSTHKQFRLLGAWHSCASMNLASHQSCGVQRRMNAGFLFTRQRAVKREKHTDPILLLKILCSDCGLCSCIFPVMFWE